MEKDTIKQKVLDLTDKINEHNYNYYVSSNPTIRDYEYVAQRT